MNRSTTFPAVFSNRLASRRLHRRPTTAATQVCYGAVQPISVCMPAIVSGLPEFEVRKAGMLELLAAEMRIAELEKALVEASAAALTDPLTGALNRRGFEQECEREIARAARRGTGYAVVFIDLDDFKSLNDACGHDVGDCALVGLVRLLKNSLRPTDVISRFGGEEFVLLLPETSLVDAETIANRVLKAYSTRVIPGTQRCVTFSAGVSALTNEESLDDVIRRADAAVYRAKRHGKNTVVVD